MGFSRNFSLKPIHLSYCWIWMDWYCPCTVTYDHYQEEKQQYPAVYIYIYIYTICMRVCAYHIHIYIHHICTLYISIILLKTSGMGFMQASPAFCSAPCVCQFSGDRRQQNDNKSDNQSKNLLWTPRPNKNVAKQCITVLQNVFLLLCWVSQSVFECRRGGK